MLPFSDMEGVPSAAFRLQPVRSIELLVLLYSSIHSSLEEMMVLNSSEFADDNAGWALYGSQGGSHENEQD